MGTWCTACVTEQHFLVYFPAHSVPILGTRRSLIWLLCPFYTFLHVCGGFWFVVFQDLYIFLHFKTPQSHLVYFLPHPGDIHCF